VRKTVKIIEQKDQERKKIEMAKAVKIYDSRA
jgi:hypothetical protein